MPTWVGSPNYTTGRNGVEVDTVVLHIMEGTMVGCRVWFNNPASGVSSHYGVGTNGQIDQYVDVKDTAWHAGSREWNRRSVGIECEGYTGAPWPQAQVDAVVCLIDDIEARYQITSIKGHCEVNPAKVNCPGAGCPIEEIRMRCEIPYTD